MTIAQPPPPVVDEMAQFLASVPTAGELLDFRPSDAVQARAQELLSKQNSGALSEDETRELEQYTQVELLMRLVKARLRSNAVT